MTKDSTEILTADNPNRYVIFPIHYNDVWQFYKQVIANFWSVEEIDTITDSKHWDNLSETERHFLSILVAYLATDDGDISKNIVQNLSKSIEIPEIRAFFGIQIAMENMHSEMYSLLLTQYISDETELSLLINTTQNFDYYSSKKNWVSKWINHNELTIGQRLLAYAVSKSVFFAGSLASIKSLKKKSILTGLTTCSDNIFRDKSLYSDFAILLNKYVTDKPSREYAITLIEEAVEIETKFLNLTLPVAFIGLDCKKMTSFIKHSADSVLSQLGFAKLYNAENPFDFVEKIEFIIEKKVENVAEKESNSFNMVDDF